METKVYILKKKTGEIICNKMIVANSFHTRLLGLMFSEQLPNCDGFLISPCNSIHTFFMRYSLDILFLDKDYSIVKAIYNISPWKMTWIYFKSRHVLEMKSGTMLTSLKTGDQLEAICIN